MQTRLPRELQGKSLFIYNQPIKNALKLTGAGGSRGKPSQTQGICAFWKHRKKKEFILPPSIWICSGNTGRTKSWVQPGAAMLCTIAAALMLSRDVFYFLNFTNSGLGRKLHMVATVWTFLLESLHLGFHWEAVQKSITKKIILPATLATAAKWFFRLVLMAVCLYGIFAFRSRNLCNEMFLLTEFKFMDFEEPPLYFFADHAAISLLAAAAGFYLKKLAVSAGKG